MIEITSIEQFQKIIMEEKNVCIFGAGFIANELVNALNENQLNMIKRVYVTQENIKSDLRGIRIEKYKPCKNEFVVVCVGAKWREEILESIDDEKKTAFISDRFEDEINKNYRLVKDNYRLNDENIKLKACIERIVPKKRLKTLVVNICDHCNLNCRGCDHFSPIADENNYECDIIERDLREMKRILGDKIDLISVMGGEPLLHPDLISILRMIRSIFLNVNICLSSNGIGLLNQDETFWQCCKENNISLNITKYPIKFDYEKAESVAVEHGVEYKYYHGGVVEKTLGHYPIDIDGKQNPYESFLNCFHANNTCNMLQNGKLYPCTIAPNFPIFCKKYELNNILNDDDGIDIYRIESADDLFEQLCRPMRACRYCMTLNRTYGKEWGQSKGCISEWT